MKRPARLRAALGAPLGALIMCSCHAGAPMSSEPGQERATGPDPLNTTYRVEGEVIELRDGYYERPAAPGSAAKMTLAAFDSPVYGPLNSDGENDAALVLVLQGGGSGTFFYAVAAINVDGGYAGTNAVFLGDRIVPEAVRIQNRNIAIDFAEREPGEAFAVTPSVHVTDYAHLSGSELVRMPREQDVSGWVTFGHEVRAFRSCDANDDHWLLGISPALSVVEQRYRENTIDERAYTPVFMKLSGSVARAPADGFGADYTAGFFVTGVTDVDDSRHCREEYIVVESPTPSTVIESPLTIAGRARGSWFFEGDFPIMLEDASGNVVARGFVTAQGEWMTQDFVRFTGSLSFVPPESDGGRLVFIKDNPSDRRELDDHMSIPVWFRGE